MNKAQRRQIDTIVDAAIAARNARIDEVPTTDHEDRPDGPLDPSIGLPLWD